MASSVNFPEIQEYEIDELNNRRLEPRTRVHLPLICHIGPVDYPGESIDLSPSGMRVRIPVQLTSGQTLSLSVLPESGLQGRQPLRCRSLWVRDLGGEGYEVGTCFDDSAENFAASWAQEAITSLNLNQRVNRKHRRIPAKIYANLDDSQGRLLGNALCLNLSYGGALLFLDGELSESQLVFLKIGSKDSELVLQAKVAQPGTTHTGQLHRLSFLPTGSSQRAQLRALLQILLEEAKLEGNLVEDPTVTLNLPPLARSSKGPEPALTAEALDPLEVWQPTPAVLNGPTHFNAPPPQTPSLLELPVPASISAAPPVQLKGPAPAASSLDALEPTNEWQPTPAVLNSAPAQPRPLFDSLPKKSASGSLPLPQSTPELPIHLPLGAPIKPVGFTAPPEAFAASAATPVETTSQEPPTAQSSPFQSSPARFSGVNQGARLPAQSQLSPAVEPDVESSLALWPQPATVLSSAAAPKSLGPFSPSSGDAPQGPPPAATANFVPASTPPVESEIARPEAPPRNPFLGGMRIIPLQPLRPKRPEPHSSELFVEPINLDPEPPPQS